MRILMVVCLLALTPLFALDQTAACGGDCPWRAEYIAMGVATAPTGTLGSGFVCLDRCAEGGDGVGGGRVVARGEYHNAIGSASDTLYGSEVAMWLCGGPTDEGCAAATGVQCGTLALIGSEEPFQDIIGHVLALHVDAELSVCGGSEGLFWADFF